MAAGGEAAAIARWTPRSSVSDASERSEPTAASSLSRSPLGADARAGEAGGVSDGRTRERSCDTSRRAEPLRTWATAPTCGWHSFRIRGKESTVAMGTRPSYTDACSIGNESAAIRSDPR